MSAATWALCIGFVTVIYGDTEARTATTSIVGYTLIVLGVAGLVMGSVR